MTTAIFIVMALALVHFIYGSILAPDLRLWLTWKLHELRDEADTLEKQCADTAARYPCTVLRESVETLIPMLHYITVSSLILVEFESRKDPGPFLRAQQRARVLDGCTLARVREIRRRMLDLTAKAIIVNSIGWAPLLLAPWLITSAGFAAARKRLRILVSLNRRDLARLSSIERAATAPT